MSPVRVSLLRVSSLHSRFNLCYLLVAFIASLSVQAQAHPHVFADVGVTVLYDASGFSGIKNHWVYDEAYSMAMLSSVDKNGDGKLSPAEQSSLQTAVLNPIEPNNYYNYVLAGSDFLKAAKVRDFKATMVKGKLVLDFVTVFSKPAGADWTMLVVVVADPTNYIQMTSDMENADVDAPKSLEVEYFSDGLDGLTLFKAFRSEIEGLYLRYKKK